MPRSAERRPQNGRQAQMLSEVAPHPRCARRSHARVLALEPAAPRTNTRRCFPRSLLIPAAPAAAPPPHPTGNTTRIAGPPRFPTVAPHPTRGLPPRAPAAPSAAPILPATPRRLPAPWPSHRRRQHHLHCHTVAPPTRGLLHSRDPRPAQPARRPPPPARASKLHPPLVASRRHPTSGRSGRASQRPAAPYKDRTGVSYKTTPPPGLLHCFPRPRAPPSGSR